MLQQQNSIEQLKSQLVQQIAEYVQDEAILAAFRRVERHQFVIEFYNRSPEAPRQWSKVSVDDPQWLTEIYTNRPLTTSLDQYGNPNCSSSQPNLMAQMIQSAGIRKGMHVLEIGTGTGYNAAIMNAIGANVTTLDVNPGFVTAARTRLNNPAIAVLQADGRNLPDDLRKFDAIIVTGAHSCIEPEWIRALESGGRIVFNWARSFTTVMIEAQKDTTILRGKVCSYGGDFMRLHDGNGVEPQSLPYKKMGLIQEGHYQEKIFDNADMCFFLQICIPTLRYYRYKKPSGERVYVVQDATTKMAQIFETSVRGSAELWQQIAKVYQLFEQMNRPDRSTFLLEADEQAMTFTCQQKSFRILYEQFIAPIDTTQPGDCHS